MIIGIILVLSACLVWGLIFVIPQLLVGFTPLEIALGRYFFFGCFSCLFLLCQGLKKWRKIPSSLWFKAWIYGLATNLLYYFALVLGMTYSSSSVIALICGISPITISFYGNWRQKECSYEQLILPSLMLGAGLIFVNIPSFELSSASSSLEEYLFGLLCGFFALALWNWYVVSNAQLLKENPQLNSIDWATMIGANTLFWVFIVGGALVLGWAEEEHIRKYIVWSPELKNFLIGSFILGVICAWLGSLLWNFASKRLPVSFAGQLTIFETVFGLLFVYMAEHRFPSTLEWIGIVIILGGVILCLNIFKNSIPHAETQLEVAQ